MNQDGVELTHTGFHSVRLRYGGEME
jgi:hypothetical protein